MSSGYSEGSLHAVVFFILREIVRTHFLIKLIFFPELFKYHLHFCISLTQTRHSNHITQTEVKIAYAASLMTLELYFFLLQYFMQFSNYFVLFLFHNRRQANFESQNVVFKR